MDWKFWAGIVLCAFAANAIVEIGHAHLGIWPTLVGALIGFLASKRREAPPMK